MKKRVKKLYTLLIRVGFFRTIKLLSNKKHEITDNQVRNKNNSLLNVTHVKYNFTFHLRDSVTDIDIFKAVILENEYDFDCLFNPQIIIDCGANIGLTSIFFSNKFSNSKIFAIEPENNNYSLLLKNTEKYINIIPLHNAVSNKIETLGISNGDNTGWGVKYSNKSSINLVETLTVSYLIENYNIEIIDILKIDIEGGECELFSSNYENWLPKTKLIIIELHNMINKEASNIFFKALNNYDFEIFYKGENLFCFNKSI